MYKRQGQNNPKARIVQDEVPEVELLSGDLTDLSSLIAAVEQVQPDEVYNLGAVSFVKLSFTQPELTAEVTGSGAVSYTHLPRAYLPRLSSSARCIA